mmetsp:Transcript_7033/g.22615  ORF Transcript_7033/g.22615 Transcript_7033/m.22615 type:complete len:250 (-) Transcript_7033:712-1461(-)
MILCDGVDVGSPHQAHAHLKLVLEDLEHLTHAFRAERSERVNGGAPNAHCSCPKCKRFEDICTTPDAAVYKHLEVLLGVARFLAQRRHHFGENLDTRPCSVKLPAAVIGQNHSGAAIPQRQHGVLCALHAFENDRQRRDALEEFQVGPVEARVDERRDGPGHTLVTVDSAVLLVVALHIRALRGKFVAHVFFTTAELWGVHGDEERLDPACFKLGHVLSRALAVLVDIELRKDHLARRTSGEHFVQRAR